MNQRPILHNKAYLYLTEFFAGVSVMAVELGASRLGTSRIVNMAKVEDTKECHGDTGSY